MKLFTFATPEDAAVFHAILRQLGIEPVHDGLHPRGYEVVADVPLDERNNVLVYGTKVALPKSTEIEELF